jgi:O-antigen ligase
LRFGARKWLIVALGASIPIPYAFRPPGAKSGGVAVGLIIWVVVAGILVLAGNKEWARLRQDNLARILLAFLIVGALSLPIGILVYHNTEGLRSYAYQVTIIANVPVGYVVLRSLDDIVLFLRGYVLSIGALATVLALYLLQAGIVSNVHLFHNSEAIRSAVYGWPNYYSILLAAGLITSLYFVSASAGRMRWLYVGLTAGLSICLALTFSKTGWVVVAFGLWLLWLRYWSVGRQALLVAGVVAAGVVLYFASNDSFRMQVFTLRTLGERLQFFAIVLQHANPLILFTGSGSQTVDTLVKPVAQMQLVPGIRVGDLTTHDEFLNVLVKHGVIGLVLLVAALTVIALRARRLTTSADPATARLFRYWYAAYLAIVLSLFSADGLHYWPVCAAFWMLAGAAVHRLPARERPPTPGAEALSDRTC